MTLKTSAFNPPALTGVPLNTSFFDLPTTRKTAQAIDTPAQRPTDRIVDFNSVWRTNPKFEGYSKDGSFPGKTATMFPSTFAVDATADKGAPVLNTIRPIHLGAGLSLPQNTTIYSLSLNPDLVNPLEEGAVKSDAHALRFDLPNGKNFYIAAGHISIDGIKYPTQNVAPLFDPNTGIVTVVSLAPSSYRLNLLMNGSLMSFLNKESPAAARALQKMLAASSSPAQTAPATPSIYIPPSRPAPTAPAPFLPSRPASREDRGF